MYRELEEINSRPEPFSHYTAADLWTDEHTSKKMLEFHLDGSIDVSSRRTDFIDRSGPYFGFMSAFKYNSEKVSLDKYTIIEETRTRVVYNWLQYFDPESLKREIEGSGLALEEVLGDVAGGAYHPAAAEFAVIVRGRPGS